MCICKLKGLVSGFFNREWTLCEKVLMVADCILFGVLLGAIWSPKREKYTSIGSYNSNSESGCCCCEDEDEYEDEE